MLCIYVKLRKRCSRRNMLQKNVYRRCKQRKALLYRMCHSLKHHVCTHVYTCTCKLTCKFHCKLLLVNVSNCARSCQLYITFLTLSICCCNSCLHALQKASLGLECLEAVHHLKVKLSNLVNTQCLNFAQELYTV